VSRISKYRDRTWRVNLKLVSYFVFFSGINLSQAQSGITRSQLAGNPTQSNSEAALSVSLTVVGSITVLFGPDGEQTLVMANVPENEMRQMLADFEARKIPHLSKELRSRKMHADVPGQTHKTGKEQ
jgi:hypothetical protein